MAWTPQSYPNGLVLFGGSDEDDQKDKPSAETAEVVPGVNNPSAFPPLSEGCTFELKHNGERTCGIPDGKTFVLTGGGIPFLDGKRRGLELHNFVTRFDI